MANKKSKKSIQGIPRRWNKRKLRKYVLSTLKQNAHKPLNYKQIAKVLEVKDDGIRLLIIRILTELVSENLIDEPIKGKYTYLAANGMLEGVVDITRSGTAYVVCEGEVDDVIVSPHNIGQALHGDEVRVQLFAHRRKGGRAEGEILEVISRAKDSFVGIIQVKRHFAFLLADAANMHTDIYIPLEALNGAKDGEKVIAKIIEWPKNAKNPIGEVQKILGKPGLHETEMHAILAEFDLPYSFDKDIETAAEAINPDITAEEIAKRRDFRNITTFTIDPFDAKDFDDALSVLQLPNGNWEVGIHIADVTHYIDNAPILDDEAYERGTSVYLVDRVVPMLPERLSNFICSLRPNEEKLCFSAVFELNEAAEIQNEWIGRTIINSDRRFTYEQAQEIIEGAEGDYKPEMLKLDELAKKLRTMRFTKGALAFDRAEAKFELDENGKPIGVYYKEMKDSNKLVEEFMLLANRQVARFVGKVKDGATAKTFIYRVHDDPDPEKLSNLSRFIKRFGLKMQLQNRITTIKSMNDILSEVKGRSEENLVTTLAIRTMAKAEYTTDNIGHYGLAFDFYSHFTSPIRRYPDVMVHRLLAKYLKGGKSEDYTTYKKWSLHCSKREVLATNAERASIKFKQVEFMTDKIGEVFDGTITGVTEWGIYVELSKNKIEGMVPLREMMDDYYEYDDKNYCIIGHRTKKVYQLGNKITVEIIRTDLVRKVIDFSIAE